MWQKARKIKGDHIGALVWVEAGPPKTYHGQELGATTNMLTSNDPEYRSNLVGHNPLGGDNTVYLVASYLELLSGPDCFAEDVKPYPFDLFLQTKDSTTCPN